MIGQKLLHYEIVEKLGEGGMGVVYKARDTHLDRFVAIKVLPPEKVADAGRKARFVQEAKAASALNHPNIVVVHDIASDGGTDFIAMEYVAGKTLDQLIPRKGMRLNDALKVAVQIGDALSRAHSVGIIHRDLKPSNLMVDEHDQVKVLDFGLAKLTEKSISEDDATATVGVKTEEGAIVGTAAYMSPEQAEGRPVDARSDIFSFGSVLYEMVAGRRAFEGGSRILTLSAVLRQEPAPFPEEVPGELRRIVSRCLKKNPDRRYHHVIDLKVALEELREESESGTLAVGVPVPVRMRRQWPAAAVGVCGVAVVAAVFWLRSSNPLAQQVELKAVPLTADPGMEMQPSFSPDATQVAYVWNGESGAGYDLYIKQVGSDDRRRLASDPANEGSPAWSPDGRLIAFLRSTAEDRARLVLISPLGTRERPIAEGYFPRWDNVEFPAPYLAWTPDSATLAVVTRDTPGEQWSIHTLSVQTRERRDLTSPPPSVYADVSPAFSPDGRKLAFVRLQGIGAGDVYVLDLTPDLRPAGEPKRVTRNSRYTTCPVWTPDGKEILFLASAAWEDAALWRVPFDGSSAPRKVTSVADGIGQFSLSRSGRQLVFQKATYDHNIWRLPLDGSGKRAGNPVHLLATTRTEYFPRFSPDGARIAFTSNRSGSFELYVADRDGAGVAPVTNLRAAFMGVSNWSPDGRRIAFAVNLEGHRDIFVVDPDGGGPSRPLVAHPNDDTAPAWSRDGKVLYFCPNRSGDFQVWRTGAGGGPAVQMTTTGGVYAQESPDGKFVYFTRTRGTTSLWRMPAEGGQPEFVLEPVLSYAWQLTGDGLYYVRPDPSGLTLVFLPAGADKPATLVEGLHFAYGVSVAPDGRSILYSNTDKKDADLMLVENFR